MARKAKIPTPEQMLKSVYVRTKQIQQAKQVERECVVISKAQAKRIFQALNTVTLYLHQPEHARALQIERIIGVRDTLEQEFEEQTGKSIDA
ncbi:hypothetical protein [Runella salmonicolor]|uniref:Mobilization protein n=1 Tax=Runella salmonicolor TaxID=2950278 RepID=A0ABT1FSU3_9BACT|nr:hypothetical protein [Runella salmonicolor]MCP1384809.1 hypothetical protein [Runella salmonicolor]